MLVLDSLAKEPQHVHGPALNEKVNDISHAFSNKYSIRSETTRSACNQVIGRQTLPLMACLAPFPRPAGMQGPTACAVGVPTGKNSRQNLPAANR